MPHFIHLHCHTEYSLVDSLISLKPFVKTVRERGMPACAVTDQNNLFALVKFYRAAQSEGIKPIIGVDVRLSDGLDTTSRLLLLCQNDTGYRNLTRLVSKSYTKGQVKGIPYLHREWLKGATDGLLALSGGREGDIGQALLAGHPDLVRQRLANWQALFPQRFYLEVQRTGRANEEEYLHAAVELALATDTPVVATNDVCFLHPDDFQAHEVRVCIHEGYTLTDSRRPHHYSPQQYLRSPPEMAELFADLPEALENSWLIAQRCNLELTLGKNFLPDFPIPPGQTVAEYFSQQARLGLEQRLATLFDNTRPEFAEQRRPYDERLTRELGVILQMGFPGYFLIVADFIQWAKDNNIPVGPGRGSGAGSLVAYALRITDLDPLKYELLFERFLNPERVSMPDFDIDFCMEGRDAVIDYVAKRYGRDRVSQIITYGSMAAKGVVRDVGRVLGHPHGFVDKIAKLIPFEVGITLDKALEDEPELRSRYQQEEEVRVLIDMAKKLEGLTRNPGKHAGGVVIAPTLLTDFTPLYCEQDSTDLITQFDKDDVEAIGLVKFDFLGLRTLTIIKWALATINRLHDEPLDILKIPLTDKNTFDLLRRGDTTAVFQLESSGIKKLVKRLQPDRFEDLVALVALYRPGPLQSGMVDDFIDRKQGKARIEYPHPDLAPILKPTYGVIVYQEQVMQIAQVLAGYTLGGADLLRRAMGKKQSAEMAKQRATFVGGAKERGVKEETATYIFDLMEKFAEYGFNKSHSAAYALISYQTAWLKTHYPAPFMAAVLSADMDKTEKVVHIIDECRAMNLKILPPDVNVCDYLFTVDENQSDSIRYGLGALKGIGEAAVENILTERKQRGPFIDLFDFCRRIDLRKANRRVLEALVSAGGLDKLGPNRATLMASIDSALKVAEKHSTDRATGQNDIFAASPGKRAVNRPPEEPKPFIKVANDWSLTEKLQGEKDVLGIYLSGHPINQYLPELAQLSLVPLAKVRATEYKQALRVGGWVIDCRSAYAKGKRMAFFTVEDDKGRLEVKVPPELYEQKQSLLTKDTLLIVEGEVREDDYNEGYTMTANQIVTLDQARDNQARRLEMTVAANLSQSGLAQRLIDILTPYRQAGRCRVLIYYQHPDALVELLLGENWRVQPHQALIQQLQEMLGGEEKVKVVY
jgi:DNA polymerase-3 subunit alpha